MQAANSGCVLGTISASIRQAGGRGNERALAGPTLSLGVMLEQTVHWEGMHTVHTGFSYEVEEDAASSDTGSRAHT